MKVKFDYYKERDKMYLEMSPENQYEWNWCKFLLKAIKEDCGYGYSLDDKVFDIKIYDWNKNDYGLNELFENTVDNVIKNNGKFLEEV